MSTRFLLLIKDLLIHQARHLYQDKWMTIIRQKKKIVNLKYDSKSLVQYTP